MEDILKEKYLNKYDVIQLDMADIRTELSSSKGIVKHISQNVINELREYIDLLRGMFKGERSKSFTKLAYITGILPIKKYNSESALNNFDEFTMIELDTSN